MVWGRDRKVPVASYWRTWPRIPGTPPHTIKEIDAAREREELGDSKKRRVTHVGDEGCGDRRR